MKRDSVFSKILRWVGIILMGLTSLFTLMGGIGTVCAALFPENFAADSEAMAALIGWEWLYITFMLVTTAIGVMMVRATVLLIKGTANAYRDTIISLVAAVVVGFIHIYASRTIRGGSMPVDMVIYSCRVHADRLPDLPHPVHLAGSQLREAGRREERQWTCGGCRHWCWAG